MGHARHTPRLALDRNNMGHRTSHELGENNLINRIESLHIKAGLARCVLSQLRQQVVVADEADMR